MTEEAKTDHTDIEKLISEMSLEQLVGQLIVTGFPGFQVPAALSALIEDRLVGGVILFRRNLFDTDQTENLCERIHGTASKAGEKLPFLVMIDQEGGRVTRFDFTTMLPSAMALGAAGSRSYAYLAGEICGKELNALGINVNLAPVLDLLTNPQNTCIGTRSFGSNPQKVAQLGAQYINGLHSAKVMAVAKHFPGLGAASFDTHRGPASIVKTLDEMLASDLVPFAEAFKSGVLMVMAGHSEYGRLCPQKVLPASLSRYVLNDLLRDKMGFGGAAITDDLSMGAISSRYGPEDAAIAALMAGADVLLFCHELERIRDIHKAIMKALKDGSLPAERLVEAALRTLWFKAELEAISKAEGRAKSLEQLDLEEHELLAYEIAENAICIVRNEDDLLPIDPDVKILVIHPKLDQKSNIPPPRHCATIYDALTDYFPDVSELQFDLSDPLALDVSQLRCGAELAELILLCTFSASQSEAQQELAREVLSLGKPCILAALDEPFDVGLLKDFNTAIASFGFREPSVRAIAAVLAGEVEAEGSMPVEIG